MYDNTIKRPLSSLNSTDLDLLAGIPTTIGELEGEDGIPSRAKILKIAKQDMLKTSRHISGCMILEKGRLKTSPRSVPCEHERKFLRH